MTRRSILAMMILELCFSHLSECIWKDLPRSCKFPNESCDGHSECCSGKCVAAHPGTNARCTKLTLHKPCLFTYQCDNLLRCGRNNTCCAKYWGICRHPRDCCDPLHKCIEADGFYYRRCLYSSNLTGSWIHCANWQLVFLLKFVLATLVTGGGYC